MSRDLTTPVSNALDDAVIYPFFAVDLDFDTAPLYVWSGYGDLVIGAKTYIGVGSLMSVSAIQETTEIDAKNASLSLSGIPTAFLSLALQEQYSGRECRIYFGVTDSPSDYVEIFSGEMDQMTIEESGETCMIQVSAESIMVKLERAVVRRFTNADQQARYPGDLGFEFVAALQGLDLVWGRKSA